MEEYPAEGTDEAGEYECAVTISCDHCGISMTREYRSEAVEEWNTRKKKVMIIV